VGLVGTDVSEELFARNTDHYVRGHQLCIHAVVSQHFIESKCSIPRSQELSTCPYPEPDQSSPHPPILSLLVPSLCYPPIYVLLLLVFSFALGFSIQSIRFPLLPICATCSAHLILLDFIILIILGAEYNSRSSSLCSFLHHPVTPSL
jgi:hypothetical protein